MPVCRRYCVDAWRVTRHVEDRDETALRVRDGIGQYDAVEAYRHGRVRSEGVTRERYRGARLSVRGAHAYRRSRRGENGSRDPDKDEGCSEHGQDQGSNRERSIAKPMASSKGHMCLHAYSTSPALT